MRVFSTRKFTVVIDAAKVALAANNGIAENGSPSSDFLFVDLDTRLRATPVRSPRRAEILAKTRDENAFEEHVGHCISAEENAREWGDTGCKGAFGLSPELRTEKENEMRKEVKVRVRLMEVEGLVGQA